MKGKIYLYLFVFTLLLVIFQFVNSKNVLDTYEKRIASNEEKIEKYKDSIVQLADKNLELMHFNIDFNEDAREYFERQGYDAEQLIGIIQDQLISTNIYEGDDHPLVPYASMTDKKMLINTIKLINHKWIVADFTDGKHWGELFLTYELTEARNLDFKLVEYTMYMPNY
jgi:hypothetical protein